MFVCGTERMPESKVGSTFWFSLLEWIRDARSTQLEDVSVTRKQDQLMRICSSNQVIYAENEATPWYRKNDVQALRFLQQHCQESQYMHVSFSDLRRNTCDTNQSMFFRYFMTEFYGAMFFEFHDQNKATHTDYNQEHMVQYASCLAFSGPLYIVSRLATTLFPVWIVLYLYANDIFVWSALYDSSDAVKIDLFQVFMLTVYLLLLSALLVISIMNLREQYLLFHFLGSQTNLGSAYTVEAAKKWINANSTASWPCRFDVPWCWTSLARISDPSSFHIFQRRIIMKALIIPSLDILFG